MKFNLLLTLLLMFSSVIMSAATADWTILVYMAADNGLSEAALSDIDEMERAAPSGSVNIIVQADLSDIYNEDGRAYRYKIEHDESEEVVSPVIGSLGEIDSGDWRTLHSFINWGFDRYPSRHKAVVIWSHGEGWDELDNYKYMCPDIDSHSKFRITEGDLANAFINTPYLDVMILDACNMQTIEVLTEVYPFADYIIGSEYEVPTDGMPYDDIFNIWNNFETTREMVMEIPEIYVNSYLVGGSQNPHNYTPNVTCSVMDSNKFGTEFLPFFKTYLQSSLPSIDELHYIRNRLMNFNTRFMDVDLKEFAYRLYQEDSSAMSFVTAIEETFPEYSHTLNSQFVGTALLWFPTENTYFQNSYSRYFKLQFEEYSKWGSVLNDFFAPEILSLNSPVLSIKTTTSRLNIEWTRVPYPDPIHYEVTIIPTNEAPTYFTTSEVELSLKVAPTGIVEIKAVCPYRNIESATEKAGYTLKGLFVAPNPVRKGDQASVRFIVPEGVEDVTILIHDIAGNRILNRILPIYSSGENRVLLHDLLKRDLSTGVYFLTLRYNEYNERTKFVIIR